MSTDRLIDLFPQLVGGQVELNGFTGTVEALGPQDEDELLYTLYLSEARMIFGSYPYTAYRQMQISPRRIGEVENGVMHFTARIREERNVGVAHITPPGHPAIKPLDEPPNLMLEHVLHQEALLSCCLRGDGVAFITGVKPITERRFSPMNERSPRVIAVDPTVYSIEECRPSRLGPTSIMLAVTRRSRASATSMQCLGAGPDFWSAFMGALESKEPYVF